MAIQSGDVELLFLRAPRVPVRLGIQKWGLHLRIHLIRRAWHAVLHTHEDETDERQHAAEEMSCELVSRGAQARRLAEGNELEDTPEGWLFGFSGPIWRRTEPFLRSSVRY
jgi:hypothetical protein